MKQHHLVSFLFFKFATSINVFTSLLHLIPYIHFFQASNKTPCYKILSPYKGDKISTETHELCGIGWTASPLYRPQEKQWIISMWREDKSLMKDRVILWLRALVLHFEGVILSSIPCVCIGFNSTKIAMESHIYLLSQWLDCVQKIIVVWILKGDKKII